MFLIRLQSVQTNSVGNKNMGTGVATKLLRNRSKRDGNVMLKA